MSQTSKKQSSIPALLPLLLPTPLRAAPASLTLSAPCWLWLWSLPQKGIVSLCWHQRCLFGKVLPFSGSCLPASPRPQACFSVAAWVSVASLERVYSQHDVGLLNSLRSARRWGPGCGFIFSLLVHRQVKQFSILSWRKRLLLHAAACSPISSTSSCWHWLCRLTFKPHVDLLLGSLSSARDEEAAECAGDQ